MPSAVLSQLPHRGPFLLVDRVLERQPGVQVVAERLISAADPLGPEPAATLLVEMLAQAGGFLEADSLHDAEIFLAGVQAVEVHGTARPGDRLRLEVWPEARFGAISRIAGEVRRDGELLCIARLLLRKGRG